MSKFGFVIYNKYNLFSKNAYTRIWSIAFCGNFEMSASFMSSRNLAAARKSPLQKNNFKIKNRNTIVLKKCKAIQKIQMKNIRKKNCHVFLCFHFVAFAFRNNSKI